MSTNADSTENNLVLSLEQKFQQLLLQRKSYEVCKLDTTIIFSYCKLIIYGIFSLMRNFLILYIVIIFWSMYHLLQTDNISLYRFLHFFRSKAQLTLEIILI